MSSRSNATAVTVLTGAAVLLLCCALLGALVTVSVLGGIVGGGGCAGDGGPGGGSRQVGPRTFSAEQTANAQLITNVAITRGLPRRAAVIAVATAIVESGLRNLAYGDRDSLGLFQQRPSQGWGTPAQILNPTHAAHRFYDHLLALPDWARLPAGAAAQAVQRSAFPDRYGPQEPSAAALVAQFWTGPDNPQPLSPADPSAANTHLAVAALLGCPDPGGANVPLSGGAATSLPPGFTPPADSRARAAVLFAAAQLGKPYVWGATGPNSFDCSGLIQASWAAADVAVSRTTSTQRHDGLPVAGLDALAPGDLLFIPGSLGTPENPRHVGLYAGHGLVINAYDNTRGVIVQRLTDWAPKVVAIRRVTGPASNTATAGASP